MTASAGVSQLAAGNNISLASAGSTVTLNALAVALGAGAQTQTSGTVQFANSNNLTFGLSNNGVMTASAGHTGPTGVVVNASASTITNGNVVFSNSNGMYFGVNGSTITMDATANMFAVGANTINAGSTSLAVPMDSIYYSGAGNISVGMNGSTVIVSQVNPAISAGTGGGAGSANTGTIVFSNSNNVTFGWNAGTVTASFGAANTASTFNAGVGTAGNTAGTTGAVNQSIYLVGTRGITLSQSANGQSATVTFDGGQRTFLTYQNRQLGASTLMATAVHQTGQLWLVPFRVGEPISGSSLQIMQSFSGTVSSNTSGTYGQTFNMAIYSQHSTDANRFDTWWSTQKTLSMIESGTGGSNVWAWGGSSSSVANSTFLQSQVYGMRLMSFAINSIVPPGLYIFGMNIVTSAGGYTQIMATNSRGIVFDAPLPVAMGNNFGAVPASNIGYVDAGTWTSQTTAGIPLTVSIGHIAPVSNFVPYFKIGAL
jgi:hypothetical protein